MCPQPTVDTKTEFLKLRLEPKLKARIKNLAEIKGKSASELTRLLWQDYFKKVDKIAWEKEVAEW